MTDRVWTNDAKTTTQFKLHLSWLEIKSAYVFFRRLRIRMGGHCLSVLDPVQIYFPSDLVLISQTI